MIQSNLIAEKVTERAVLEKEKEEAEMEICTFKPQIKKYVCKKSAYVS